MTRRYDFVVILPPFPHEGSKPVIFRPVTDKGREFSQSYQAIPRRGIMLGIVTSEAKCHETLDAINAAGLSIEVL